MPETIKSKIDEPNVTGVVKLQFDDDKPCMVGKLYNNKSVNLEVSVNPFGDQDDNAIIFEDTITGKKMRLWAEVPEV